MTDRTDNRDAVLRRVGKSAKATINFVMSVCPSVLPSVRVEQLGSHWTDFREIWYFSIFWKSVKKFKFHWNLTRIAGTLHEDLCTFVIISPWILLRNEKCFGQKLYRKSKHAFYFNTFSRKSRRLSDDVEKHGTVRQATDDNIIRRMRIACCITKARHTLRISNTHCFSR
jgi:hypothetical protein